MKIRLLSLGLLCLPLCAHAQFAVIDVASIVQLVQQVRMLQQQLEQAKTEFDSITGPRGMEKLLEGTVRNYLPADWQELAAALDGTIGAYGDLAQQIQAVLQANAILSEEQLAGLSLDQRREVQAARRSAAGLQALAREALAATSARFDSIQALIDAIGEAEDQKSILDLQARIGAEHDMLINESSKLQLLYQNAQAEEWARHQREREQGLAGIGSLRDLPPMGL